MCCKDANRSSTTDEDTKYIGLVNAVASFADQEASTGKYNPFHARRLFHSATPPTDNTRLFRYQSLVVEQNRLNIDIQSFKNEGVSRSTLSKLSSESTTDPILNTLSVVNSVAVSGPEATEKHVLRTTLELLKKRPYDLGLTLLASQIHIRASNYQAAASVLESLLSHLPDTDPTRHAPGLVALAVALYTHLGRPAAAKATLASAASHWRTAAPDTGSHDALLRAAAAALLLQRSSSSASGAEEEQEAGRDARAARAIFAGLHARRPDDAACAAGLAAALAACGPAAALAERPELVAALRPARELVDGVDVDALEAQGVARPAVAAEAAKADAADGGPARKRRKRSLPPSRRPKDFVEGREPADKERWLPLRERSYWRPKGKKGRARAAGLTQGGVVEEKEKSGTVSEVKKAAPSAKGKKKKGRK
jgi:signal recognition particle subunit SRP72